ncbi:MAG TPA: hypothetical protein PL041_13140 [Melioribacteraceae bacterium]|nr:hypothetical protein [Melioribacteraceae bacterium]
MAEQERKISKEEIVIALAPVAVALFSAVEKLFEFLKSQKEIKNKEIKSNNVIINNKEN